jgi:uncharacterized protein YqkB
MAAAVLSPSDLELVNSIVSKIPGDAIVKQSEVLQETTKEGTVFKKAKSVKAPRILITTKHKLYLFDSTGKSLKDKRYSELWFLDIYAIDIADGGKTMTLKSRINRTAQEMEVLTETWDLTEIALAVRLGRRDLAPDWPEISITGQPLAFPLSAQPSTFETFRTTYHSLCAYHGVAPSAAALIYVENLHALGDRDFVVHNIPGADSISANDKDALSLSLNLAPLLQALRFDRYFLGLTLQNIVRREVLPAVAQVVRNNFTLTKLQLWNNDAEWSALMELAISMKENRALRLQMFELSEHKNVDHRVTEVLASMLTTYPSPRLTHLNLGKSGVPAKGLSKLFQAFTMNYSVSLGITHLNLSGAKFDSDSVAALELWLELGGNYSYLEEFTVDSCNFPLKVLPKFKSCSKLNRLDLSNILLNSSTDMKFVTQLLTESTSLRRILLTSCGIEKSSILDSLFEAIKKMKCDDIELNLSNNSAPATESNWIKVAKECKLKSMVLTNIHFKDSVIELLLNSFKSIPSLRFLSLDDSKVKLRNPETAAVLATYPALETLSLANAFDAASTFALLSELVEGNLTIQSLDISFNNLGDELAHVMIRLIHQNRHIGKLNFDGNGLTLSSWQGIYQALRSANAATHTVQYPHADMVALISWASSLPRQSALAKAFLNIHELLRSVTIDQEAGTQGSLVALDGSGMEKWTSPLDSIPAAPIPSHLASQHKEMKLEDLADWGGLQVANGAGSENFASSSGGSISAASSPAPFASLASNDSPSPSPPATRPGATRQTSSASIRRPSAVEVFNLPSPSLNSSSSSLPTVSPRSSSNSSLGVPGLPGAPKSGASPPGSPRAPSMSFSSVPLPMLPGTPPVSALPKLPPLPAGSGSSSPRSASVSQIGRPSPKGPHPKTPIMNTLPKGHSGLPPPLSGPPMPGTLPSHLSRSPSVTAIPDTSEEMPLAPASNLSFGSFGQADEEIDAEEPVRRATLNEMVIRLTHQSSSDVKFMHTFLLTYRATVEPAELLDRLITRYFSRPPAGATDVKAWVDQTLRPIRVRVMNVLKRWCEAHWQDFASDESLIAMLNSFLQDGTVVKCHEAAASILTTYIQKQAQLTRQKGLISSTLRSRFDPAKMDSAMQNASSDEASSGMVGLLAKYSVEEIAEQMCLLESDLFQSLQIKEFFNQGWNKGSNEQKDAVAPNIRLMIKVSNQVITWIAHEILRQPKADARAKAITKAIALAQALMDRNNFNGVKEITAGLALSSVQRLKKAWSAVKPKVKQTYNDLTDRCANMQSLRQLPHSTTPPLVPYLGVYLTDLVFIEDGNPNTFEEDGSTFINFRKMSIMGEVLMEISSYQHDRYAYNKLDDLYFYLLTMETHSDTELYNLSVAAEPKVKK